MYDVNVGCRMYNVGCKSTLNINLNPINLVNPLNPINLVNPLNPINPINLIDPFNQNPKT